MRILGTYIAFLYAPMELKMIKRKPFKNPPVLNPSYLLERLNNDQIHDKLIDHILFPAFILVWTIYEWARYLFEFGAQHLVATLVCIVSLTICVPRIIQLRNRVQCINNGADGETPVDKMLEDLRRHNFQVFHDIPGSGNPGDGASVDYVLIGPGGIFSVIIKNHRRPSNGLSIIKSDGKTVLINGEAPRNDPIILAKAQSRHLRKLLLESTGKAYPVKPLVVYPGWHVRNTRPDSPVLVMNEKTVSHMLTNLPVLLADDEVHLAAYHLSRYMADVSRRAA